MDICGHATAWKTHCFLLKICVKYASHCSFLPHLIENSLVIWKNFEAVVSALRIPNSQPLQEAAVCDAHAELWRCTAPNKPTAVRGTEPLEVTAVLFGECGGEKHSPGGRGEPNCSFLFGYHLSGSFFDLCSHPLNQVRCPYKEPLAAACFLHHRPHCKVWKCLWVVGLLGQRQFLLHHCF